VTRHRTAVDQARARGSNGLDRFRASYSYQTLERHANAGVAYVTPDRSRDMPSRRVRASADYAGPMPSPGTVRSDTAARASGPAGLWGGSEREILRLVALGYTNAEISQALSLAVRTVETHRSHIVRKTGAHTRAQLVRFARDAQLIE
jgi:DNA-binding NarL/FixJ family response regulator